jgi:hypothetical protein
MVSNRKSASTKAESEGCISHRSPLLSGAATPRVGILDGNSDEATTVDRTKAY